MNQQVESCDFRRKEACAGICCALLCDMACGPEGASPRLGNILKSVVARGDGRIGFL